MLVLSQSWTDKKLIVNGFCFVSHVKRNKTAHLAVDNSASKIRRRVVIVDARVDFAAGELANITLATSTKTDDFWNGVGSKRTVVAHEACTTASSAKTLMVQVSNLCTYMQISHAQHMKTIFAHLHVLCAKLSHYYYYDKHTSKLFLYHKSVMESF